MDKPWEYHANWNNTLKERQKLHDTTYMSCLKYSNSWMKEWNSGQQGLVEERNEELLNNEHKILVKL